jgi:Protein of unknown function (DUF732)
MIHSTLQPKQPIEQKRQRSSSEWIGLTVAGIAILLTGFAAGVMVTSKATTGPSPAASVPPTTATSTLLDILGPDLERRTAYLKILGEMNPDFASNPDRAVRRGQSLCLDIAEGMPRVKVEDNALKQFSSTRGVGLDQARDIVAAANRFICPKITMTS